MNLKENKEEALPIACSHTVIASSLVSVFSQQVSLDALHEIFEPRCHAGLLVRRLGLDNLE